MSIWLLAAIVLGALVLAGYAWAGASRTATPVNFHAVMPVSQPPGPAGMRTLGPLTLAQDTDRSHPQVSIEGDRLRVTLGSSAWSVPAAVLLDSAAGRPSGGALPLDVEMSGEGDSGEAAAIVYEVRGISGGDAPRLEACSFWLIVPGEAPAP